MTCFYVFNHGFIINKEVYFFYVFSLKFNGEYFGNVVTYDKEIREWETSSEKAEYVRKNQTGLAFGGRSGIAE